MIKRCRYCNKMAECKPVSFGEKEVPIFVAGVSAGKHTIKDEANLCKECRHPTRIHGVRESLRRRA